MKYLGIKPNKPRIGVFDFTCCEGCELQLANKEETLVDFLTAIEIISFREVTTSHSDDYDIALIEGCVSREDEIERLKKIRQNAKVLVAFGTCAVYGGVNKLKNAMTMDEANRIVYGDSPKKTIPARAIKDVVQVDLAIPGCPVNKAEVERVVQYLVSEIPFKFPVYPVCVECKQRSNVCLFEKGALCLGPITRAGCNAPCPTGGLGCWGCRGAAEDPNYQEYFKIAKSMGFSDQEISERLNFFGGFEGVR